MYESWVYLFYTKISTWFSINFSMMKTELIGKQKMWKSCMVAAQLFLMAHGSPSECQIDRICVCGECVVCVHDKGRKRVRDKWGGPRKEKWPDRLAWNKRKNKIAINAIVTVLCSGHMDIFQLDCHLSLYYMAEWDIYWYHSSLSGAEKKNGACCMEWIRY